MRLVVAHQGEYQDPVSVKAALSNCTVKVAFAVNTPDLEREFRIFEYKQVNFEAHPVWVKTDTSTVFPGEPVPKLLPTFDERLTYYARRQDIVDLSRERFGRDGEAVKRRIAALL